MYNRNIFLGAIIISASIFSSILAITFSVHLKNIEKEFQEEKAELETDNYRVSDQMESIKESIRKKDETLAVLEGEKNIMEGKTRAIKEKNEQLTKTHLEKIQKIKEKNKDLAGKISEFENQPLLDRLKKAIETETDEDMQKILKQVVYNLENIDTIETGAEKASRVVQKRETALAPEEDIAVSVDSSSELNVPKLARVLLLDRRYNIAVINLGRRDDIKEGQVCVFLKNEKDIASSKVISVRYNMAACFIDRLAYDHSLEDVQKGGRALVYE